MAFDICGDKLKGVTAHRHEKRSYGSVWIWHPPSSPDSDRFCRIGGDTYGKSEKIQIQRISKLKRM